jgi:multidrug efflux pump subunit AcrA (membrane-fusion protein)
VQGSQESDPEKSPERYGSSYLAMEAANRKGLPQVPVRRRRGAWLKSRLKELVLLLVILGAAAYFFRARLVPVLAENPTTLPIAQFIEAKFPVQTKNDAVPGLTTSADLPETALPQPTGGDVTFSSGQGFGTVSADDGSDSFRVVVPPEGEKPR